MRTLLSVLIPVLLVTHANGQQPAAKPSEFQLAAIEPRGTTRLSREDVARLTGLEIGKPVRLDQLQGAAEALAGSGVFTKVEYSYVTSAGRLTLTLNLEDAGWVVPVVFDNFVWFSDAELVTAVRDALPTFEGMAPQNENIPDRITRALQKALQSRNVAGTVTFIPQTNIDKKDLQFVFKVENPSPPTCAMTLQGVSPGPHKELLPSVQPLVGQAYSRLYLTGFVNSTLVDTYRRLGYWAASFAPPAPALDAGCAGVSVTVKAEEGVSYNWRSAEWKGNAALDATTLDKLLGMRGGDLADATKIKDGLRQINKAYGKIGHVRAATTFAPRLDPATRQAVFEMVVNEGPQFRMGRFEVAGFSESDAAALAKRWRLKTGDVYDTSLQDDFLSKELSAFRRPGRPPATLNLQIEPATAVINVRLVQP